jgi:uncharacterized repeat protein (TIGR03803 family)
MALCPMGGLVFDSAGNLYGTARNAGGATAPFGDGVVFKLDTAGKLTVLHTFNGTDGVGPRQVWRVTAPVISMEPPEAA